MQTTQAANSDFYFFQKTAGKIMLDHLKVTLKFKNELWMKNISLHDVMCTPCILSTSAFFSV
jgi:hypothetical protein